jgi:hypothetical protein
MSNLGSEANCFDYIVVLQTNAVLYRYLQIEQRITSLEGNHNIKHKNVSLGSLVVGCLPLEPSFNPGRGQWISKGDKNL